MEKRGGARRKASLLADDDLRVLSIITVHTRLTRSPPRKKNPKKQNAILNKMTALEIME